MRAGAPVPAMRQEAVEFETELRPATPTLNRHKAL
jgi:hypothetical protein